jgi:ABC-type sugar transport system substrate-binding protein
MPFLTSAHFVAESYGFFDEAEKLGAKIVLMDAGGYQFVDRQIQQIEDFITSQVDAIIIVACDLNGTKNVVDKAADAGIPVINVNVMTASEKIVSKIRSEDEAIGRMEAEYMAKRLNKKGNVFMINGVAGTQWAIYRSKGFVDYMKENCPDIKILDQRWCDNSPEAALKEVDDGLQVYGNTINGIYSPGEQTGMGIIQAVANAGLTGKIVVTSCDPSAAGIAAMKEGRIDAMIVQNSIGLGRWGIRAAVNVLEGKAKDLYKMYYTPLNIITRDNVNTFDLRDITLIPDGWKIPR